MKPIKALLTAIGSVLLCINIFAQNTPPYLVSDTFHITDGHNWTYSLNNVLIDDEGDMLYLNEVITMPTHGNWNIMPPLYFSYHPYTNYYGFDSFTFSACDTLYNDIYSTHSSMCDTFTVYFQVDTAYLLLSVDTTLIHDSACIHNTHGFALPLIQGGSGDYTINYISTNQNDVLTLSPYEDSLYVMKTTLVWSYVLLTIQDNVTNEIIGPFSFLQLDAMDTLQGSFYFDTAYYNSIRFDPVNLPTEYKYGMYWINYDSTYTNYQLYDKSATTFDTLNLPFSFVSYISPVMPGFIQLTIVDSLVGCVSVYTTAYNGVNHGLWGEPVIGANINSLTATTFEYMPELVDNDYDQFRIFDTLTSPKLGSVTFIATGMVYTPGIDTCGIDSFYVLVKDTSAFEPHEYIDTVLVIMNISCSKVAVINLAAPIACAGDSNAILSVTTNVTGTLTYIWSNGANTPTLTNVAAGQYNVTVTNQANQSATAMFNLSAPLSLNLTSTAQNISCYGGTNGRILNSAAGGTWPYRFSLNGGALINGNFTQLSEGAYHVMVVDDRGCNDTATYYITEPDSLIASASGTATCGTTCSGVGVVTPQGGTPPYTYIWSSGQQAATVNTLCAGSAYSITVRDSKFCSVTASISVTQGTNPLTLGFTEQHIDCNNLTGSLTAIPANGVTPYTYVWSNGITAQTATNLVVGTYSVQVHDANGCQVSGNDSILNISGLSVSVLHSTNPTCPTSLNGGAKVIVSGGAPPYSYVWQGNSSTSDTASGLGVGQHSLTVTDAVGCSYVFSFTLASLSNILLNDSVVPKFCIQGQLGEIVAQPVNGIAPYTYHWGHTASTSPHVANLFAGTYSLTVTDAYGCTAASSHVIAPYSYHISASQIPNNCQMDNGTIKVNTYGGTAPYTYIWNTNPVLTGDTISHLAAGYYQVTVTDALGCKRIGNVEVKNSCYSTITGNVFYDDNGNCLLDTSEAVSTQFVKVRAFDGFNSYYSSVNPYGVYNIKVHQIGNYQVSIVYDDCYIACNGGMVSVTVMDSVFDGPDIGVRFDPNAYDLGVNLTGGTPNAGFNTNYYIRAFNALSNGPMAGVVTLVYDAGLTYVSSTPPASNVNTFTRTITWNVSNIPYIVNGDISLMAVMHVDIAATAGQSFTSTASIAPTANDCYIYNNKDYFTREVAGAYDPNMKEAYPAEEILETDSMLNYTIHFQNTGTDTTHFVILKDTLSNLVDPGSIEFLGSSHQPCRYELSENGILTFTFDPIYLPDSATNEEGSKGFVSYSVKKKNDAPVGAVVRNTAHIYFDFNPAIVTNTTENEVTTLVSIRDIKASDNLSAKVYPNPFTETAIIETSETLHNARLVISNVNGQIVQQYQGDGSNKWLISKQNMAQGMYTFAIYSGGIVKIRGKLIAE